MSYTCLITCHLQHILFYYNIISSGGTFTFPVGKTPLHVGAMVGDVTKIKLLCDLGVCKSSKDQNGDTFYHIAARENQPEILETFIGNATMNVIFTVLPFPLYNLVTFIDDLDINEPNSSGDTALHLAGGNGNEDALVVLLRKAKLNVKNSQDETPLHVAARSHDASPNVVQMIVDVVVKAHNWSLVDAKDKLGNTALHLAASAGWFRYLFIFVECVY